MKNISVISAHIGAKNWIELCRYLTISYDCNVNFVYQYDDEEYRNQSKIMHRLRTYLFFPLRVILQLKRIEKNSDLIVVITSPFILTILIGILGSKSTKKIALMNDLYPAALILNGVIKKNGYFDLLINFLHTKSLSNFNSIVFICDQHMAHLQKTVKINTKKVIVPISSNKFEVEKISFKRNNNKIFILYSGTMGLMHDINTFIFWIKNYKGFKEILFTFNISGALKDKFRDEILQIQSQSNSFIHNIYFGGPSDSDCWQDLMINSDVGLVFQEVGAGDVVFPSKVVNILASGQAVLAIAEKNSDVGRLVIDNDCGWVVEPNDYESLNDVFISILDRDLLNKKRVNAYNLSLKCFSVESIAERWNNTFQSL
jgi:colanic acid biosynthesis glycosyl transferase WcaI